MEDVKKYILSLTEVGLYKARIEEDGKELIFSDNKFEERTLPGKVKTFDDTEELSVIDLEKEEKLAREKEGRELEVVQTGEIEGEEPESYRASTPKKLFRVAIFVIPILVAGLIFLLNNPVSKNGKEPGPTPQKTETGLDVKKSQKETPEDTEAGSEEKKTDDVTVGDKDIASQQEKSQDKGAALSGEIKDPGELQAESQDAKTIVTEADKTPAKPQEEIKDTKVKIEETKKQPEETKNQEIELKKQDVQPGKETVKPVTTSVIKTVRIIRLPSSLIRGYNNKFSKLVIPFIPVKIKVSGYLNVKVSIDEMGKSSARILSSEGLKITPEARRDNLLNLIITKISRIKLTPPKDKQGNSVRVSEFSVDYQVGKLGTRLILKKR